MTEWTTEDSVVASAEGWGLFECQDPNHPPWELQRNDFSDDGSKPTFNGDTAARRHVVIRAREGSVWELQRNDFSDDGSEPTFNGDTAAWRHVVIRAREGSVLHQRALDFLAEHSPSEYDEILRVVR